MTTSYIIGKKFIQKRSICLVNETVISIDENYKPKGIAIGNVCCLVKILL